MSPRTFALGSGLLYLALGAVSLHPAFSMRPYDLPPLHLDVSYGLLFGFFAQNVLNKIALLAFGVAGLLVAFSGPESRKRSIVYARAVAIVMGVAAGLGLHPTTSTVFGYCPLWGYQAAFHAVNALLASYVVLSLAIAPPPRGSMHSLAH